MAEKIGWTQDAISLFGSKPKVGNRTDNRKCKKTESSEAISSGKMVKESDLLVRLDILMAVSFNSLYAVTLGNLTLSVVVQS